MITSFKSLGQGGGGSYILPVASDTILGGVKIGNGATIDSGGTLSVNAVTECNTTDLPNIGDNLFYYDVETQTMLYYVTALNKWIKIDSSDITPPVHGKYTIVNTTLTDWTGEYVIVSTDDNKIAVGNLSNYYINCDNITINNNEITVEDINLVNAKKYAISDRYFVQSGTYGGSYAYAISYLNSNNERKYLTYSSNGLSNSSTVGGNNSRWHIEVNADGKLTLANIGTTTCRLYYYNGNIQQLVSSNHDSISSDYHKLSFFHFVE